MLASLNFAPKFRFLWHILMRVVITVEVGIRVINDG